MASSSRKTARSPKKAGSKKAPKKAAAKPAQPRKRTKAEAARENGKKGGRPKKKLYLEDFSQLGPPPDHPLKLARWIQRALAIDLWRQMNGRADADLSRSLRATASSMGKLIPPDIIVEAQRLIAEDKGELEAEEGAELKETEERPAVSTRPPED